MSFAPLAGRLAAHAAELRPVKGSRDTLAKFVALVMCALLEVLIYVCEALDARAVAETRSVAVAVPAAHAGSVALWGGKRARLPSLAPKVRAVTPMPILAQFETAEARPAGPRLVWPHDPCPLRAVSRMTVPSQKTAFPLMPTHAFFVTITQ